MHFLEPQFDYATSFSHGLAEVKIGARWAMVNRNGNVVWKSNEDDPSDKWLDESADWLTDTNE